MAESVEARKYERKQFDIPLPVRPKNREIASGGETGESGAAPLPNGTMAFSVLTKRGNRQQVSLDQSVWFCAVPNPRQTRTVELPSDSGFAVAMINQRQAAKEEQQRIKNLVLNYDLRESEDPEGEDKPTPYRPNTNIYFICAGNEKTASHHHHNRPDIRSGKERAGQRVRKLQLSDVDWYDNPGKRGAPKRIPSASRGSPISSSLTYRQPNI